ncbi:MAG: sigma-70 family RNA polymerase sigma factor [Verrucomicrobiales bacterium]|nr:sigma-70 family RNA polymerase sigma factor [Verrucomicrobiales bacterium]
MSEGGSSTVFPATTWSTIFKAQGTDPEVQEAALSRLVERYYRPIFLYIQTQVGSRERAEDLTQECISTLLRRNFLENVDKNKGSFRGFLKASIKNFLRDAYDRSRRQSRGGGALLHSLSEIDEDGDVLFDPPAQSDSAQEAFDRQWAKQIIDNALAILRAETERSGHARLFDKIEPHLFKTDDARPYREIAMEFGMTEVALRKAVSRIKLRLERLIREEVRATIGSEQDLSSELSYLVSIFQRKP